MKLPNRKRIIIFAALGIALFFGFCIHYDGPYEGRVLDLETGEPIEGVVVAAEWRLEQFIHWEPFCDARETITDKNGEFELPKGWCIYHRFARIENPMVVVFKPGHLGYPPLGSNNKERKSYMPDWGNPRLFENTEQYNLIKLGRPETRLERRLTYSHAGFSDDKARRRTPMLLKLSNEERRNLGFSGMEE